jgi:hypothetical protein
MALIWLLVFAVPLVVVLAVVWAVLRVARRR